MARWTVKSICDSRRVVSFLLDGVEVRSVVEADDELGFIVHLVKDEAGGGYVMENGDVKRVIRLGKVTAVFADENKGNDR